jgi:thymidylate kinase
MEEIREHGSFVFAAVKGDYGAEVMSLYNYVVVIEVPREIRLQRVRNRSFRRFGKRMLPGGDLYETEEAFFRMVEAREEDYVGKWLNVLQCPVIRVDGTRPIGENIKRIMQMIQSEQ